MPKVQLNIRDEMELNDKEYQRYMDKRFTKMFIQSEVNEEIKGNLNESDEDNDGRGNRGMI